MSRPEEEYREFVGRRAASLHRTAYLLCGDWHLANDLVQETFVQAFRHWRRVPRADNQNAYVKRILINEFKRHWRRYGGLPVCADTDHPEVAVPDVCDQVVNRADLLHALLTLPARQRATVVLRYLEGMSQRETAAVMRCSEGTVKSQTARALNTLGRVPETQGVANMNSPTEQHLAAAFRDLVAEQPFTPDVPAIEQRARQARRRDRIARAGIGAGVVAAAAVAAVGIASAVPSGPARTASGAHPANTGAAASAAGSAPAQPPLVLLAADLAAAPRPTGDATLVERETAAPGHASINVWDLYTDDGRYFFSQTQAGLPAQVRDGNNQGDGQFGREVAAAAHAVTGDLDAAALKMAWPYPTPVPAWLSAQLKNMSAGGIQIDNYVWENCEDALVAGSGNPQVRAGVLRLVSALPGIAVTHGTADGQPTLTLTAGAAELGNAGIDKANPKADTGPAYQEAITINADTGIPLQIASGPAGKVAGTVTYVVTRVSLAHIAAGKF